MPNHHHDEFHKQLDLITSDLVVMYFKEVSSERLSQGWSNKQQLKSYERYVNKTDMQRICLDYSDYIHVIPGCGGGVFGDRDLINLISTLSVRNINWVHWSESYKKSAVELMLLPKMFWYRHMLKSYSLGYFAQGRTAIDSFTNRFLNLPLERIVHLNYSPAALKEPALLDTDIIGFSRGRLTFTFVGSMIKRKSIDVILEAFRSVDGSKCCLVLVGPDRTNGKILKVIKRLGLEKKVLIYGTCAVESLNKVYAASDVILLPSRQDGWGVTLNEGASMGKALISTLETGSASHLIQPGYNGILVKAGCIKSLHTAISIYSNNSDLARLHGLNSRSIFESFYTAECNATRLILGLKVLIAANN